MTVVQNTALNPGGGPLSINVRITLMTGSASTPGYAGNEDISGTYSIPTDQSGNWSATLTPNVAITPENTYYQVLEGSAVSNIVVPASGGPYSLSELLVEEPPTQSPLAITGVQVGTAGTVEGVRPEVNFIAGTNVTISAADNAGANRVDVTVSATGGGGGAVDSVNTQTGDVTLDAGDVGAVSTSALGANDGVATLDSSGHLTASQSANLDPAGSASAAQSAAETFATNAVAAETSRAETAEAAAQSNAETFATNAVSAETTRAEAAEAGKLTTANNLSEFASNPALARGNLGLGTAATQNTAAFDAAGSAATAQTNAETFATNAVGAETSRAETAEAAKLTTANNLSELTATSATARSNLGLGSAATQASNAFDAAGAASAAQTAAEANAAATYLPLAGGTLSGPLAMGGNKATGLANGSVSTDAAAFGQIPTSAASIGGLLDSNNLSDVGSAATSFGNIKQPATTAATGVVQFENSAAALQPAGTAALGGTNLVADAGHVHPKSPWQFSPTDYGAKGNVLVVNDGAMTASSAVLTCATSTPFQSTDVGKAIIVKGAMSAATGTSLVTTILSYQSSSQVTLNASANTTVSSAQVTYGTDDTSAIQQAVNAAFTYATAHNYFAEVVFPPLWYMVAGALQTGGTTLGNAQITIPPNGTSSLPSPPKVTLGLIAQSQTANGSGVRYWNQLLPALNAPCIISAGVFGSPALQATSINNNGYPAVFGGPTAKGGYGTTASLFSNMILSIKGLTILTTHSAEGLTYTAVHAGGMACCNLTDFSYGTLGTVYGGDFSGSAFGSGHSIGVIMPANGNNDNNQCRNTTCHGGYTYGFWATEHVELTGAIIDCWAGLVIVGSASNVDGSSTSMLGSVHAVHIPQISIENCTNHIYFWGEGSGGVGPFLHGVLDSEGTPQIADTASGLTTAYGELRLTGSGGTLSVTDNTSLKIVYDRSVAGPVASPPAVTPGTAQMNAYWRPAWVTFSGGTAVTGISVSNLAGGSTAPALTSVYSQTAGALPTAGVTVRIGPGQWYEVIGAGGTVTAAWTLD